ncbi:hypothetical protein ACOSQ2_027440 [Xanthoceras sorbifolium]
MEGCDRHGIQWGVQPYEDIVILICDWYTRNYTALRTALDFEKDLRFQIEITLMGRDLIDTTLLFYMMTQSMKEFKSIQ